MRNHASPPLINPQQPELLMNEAKQQLPQELKDFNTIKINLSKPKQKGENSTNFQQTKQDIITEDIKSTNNLIMNESENA